VGRRGVNAHQDLSGQGDEREAAPERLLEVEAEEAGDGDVGDKKGKQEVDDGDGVVVKAVVQGPVGRQGVEDWILQFPAVMADLAHWAGGDG